MYFDPSKIIQEEKALKITDTIKILSNKFSDKFNIK